MPEDIFNRLAAPFPPEAVSWRVGSTNTDKTKGMALAYIDARDVMDRLDAVCGPAGWQRRHPHVNGTTTCELDIWIEGRGWVTKSDGAGDTHVEAEKGSLSDAFKRAAVNWGVGRYLYALPSPWVALVAAGRGQRISDGEFPKLRNLLRGEASLKRLTALQAKERGLHDDINGKIDRCRTLAECDAFDERFDAITAEVPLSWLDAIRNRMLMHRHDLSSVNENDNVRQNARGELETV